VDKSRIEKIIERCTPDEKIRVTTLYNGSLKALKAYQERGDAASLRDWEAAEAALLRLVEEIEARLYPAEPPLKNLTAACQALQEEGWKIKKSKLYQDAKTGKLRVQPDRTVLRADLDSYVLRAGLERVGVAEHSGKIEQGQAEKLELENAKLRKQVEKLEWELARDKGKYLLKEDVRVEVALKIAALEAGLKHWMRTGAADMVYAVGGEPAKARVLINLYEARLDELLDEMGRLEELALEVARHRTDPSDPADQTDRTPPEAPA
jgi:hypothetical protein